MTTSLVGAFVQLVFLAALGVAVAGCGDGDTQAAAGAGGTGAAAGAGAGGGAGSNAPSAGSGRDAGGQGASAGTGAEGDAGSAPRADAAVAAGVDAATPAAVSAIDCVPRSVVGEPQVRFHHIHFNTTDPERDIEFFDMFFDAEGIDFCNDESSVTRATRTDRGYFLYTQVESDPDPALNTYLEHVGWIHGDPTGEMQRLAALGAPFYPEGRAQCQEAAMGELPCTPSFGGPPYWFYLIAPSGARIEVALGPGPATSGFGHVHMIMGVDFAFFESVTNGAFSGGAIDSVNHTTAALQETVLSSEPEIVETRGKPIDHIGYSTTDLEAEHARILAAGLTIEEDISFKPSYGFRSFFLKSPKGIWVEIVEDSPFQAE